MTKQRTDELEATVKDLQSRIDNLEAIVFAIASAGSRTHGVGRITGNTLFVGGQKYEFSERFKEGSDASSPKT